MEYLGQVFSVVPCLLECSAKHAMYIGEIEENLMSLRSGMLKLTNISEDVKTRVREAEEQEKRVRNQVNGWLERVEAVENEVDVILQKGDLIRGNKCLGSCCPKNCSSSYKIGKTVVKMIPRVTRLTEEGQFDVVADELSPPPVDEQPVDNLVSLSSAMVRLEDRREDVMNRVKEAEKQNMKRANQVDAWLRSVEAIEKEVNQFLQKGREEIGNRCVGSSSPKNRESSDQLQEGVMKMVSQVTGLAKEGKFDIVADPQVDEVPMDNVVVGFESKFEEVWQSVRNDDFSVIGLVGMGGVGKTTLLKQLNNEFLKATHEYDLVIWIVVSSTAKLENIRSALRSKLYIPDHMWENKSEHQKASLIFKKLEKKKFLILLDDIWDRLELSEVGIPPPSKGNMSKIVFATRSREVCHSMDSDKVIPVGCLLPDQAFTLFYSKLGEDILKSHPEMRGLIIDVVSECEGLPLALIIIGCAMRGKTDARQWKDAKRTLEKYPSTFLGMEYGVFSKLIFSYDSLPNPMIKKCFEYCSLYLEGHNILEEEVIKLWLAEGFISEYDSMDDALIQGRKIMECLKQARLLETGERSFMYSRYEETVKMHDLIRDMALWVASDRGEKRNKFCVASGDHGDFPVAPNAMINAEKISLTGAGITTESLAGMSFSPNLATLILQDTGVEELPSQIVHSRNVLKVVHLSDNPGLMRLTADNGCLTNLEYLNIVWTSVRLTAEVSQWKKLRFLTVDDMLIIPKGIISSLCSLQVFMQVSVIRERVDIGIERKSMEREMLEELEGLKHIMDIHTVLYSAIGIQILLDSPKLQRCTTRLDVKQVKSLPDVLDFGTRTLTKHLESLRVDWCQMYEIKLGRSSLGSNLREVSFLCCDKIWNLSSLVYVPNLRILHVGWCMSMEELIGEEETSSSNVGASLFSRLTSLTLRDMPKLRRLCPQSALPFPSLKCLTVRKCESLRKLPLDSDTARTTPREFYITGEREWWEGLEWDSQATKDAFTPKFIVY